VSATCSHRRTYVRLCVHVAVTVSTCCAIGGCCWSGTVWHGYHARPVLTSCCAPVHSTILKARRNQLDGRVRLAGYSMVLPGTDCSVAVATEQSVPGRTCCTNCLAVLLSAIQIHAVRYCWIDAVAIATASILQQHSMHLYSRHAVLYVTSSAIFDSTAHHVQHCMT